MTPVMTKRVTDGLVAIGVTNPTVTQCLQFQVMLEAFDLYMERNSRYVDEWKRTGWRGMLFELRKKVSRVWQVFWVGRHRKAGDEHKAYDDALDGINYIVFFIRQHREAPEQPWGEWDDAELDDTPLPGPPKAGQIVIDDKASIPRKNPEGCLKTNPRGRYEVQFGGTIDGYRCTDTHGDNRVDTAPGLREAIDWLQTMNSAPIDPRTLPKWLTEPS